MSATSPTAAKRDDASAAEEARLARAAAAGDGSAFVALYQRYEHCAFNFAYRVTGSQADAADVVPQAFLAVTRRLPRLADRELAFGPHLFGAIRDACHEQIHGRHSAPQREKIRQEEEIREEDGIRETSMRLPERQREVLALRELVQLSYDEMATIMETNRDAVAQLISRARINLHDELRGNLLASVAAPSPECERALPLIAMRDDGQLEAASSDAVWLDTHVDSCGRCRLGVDAMQEAGASYRAWAPIAAVPWLLKETMARAAESTGADWSEEIAEAAAARSASEGRPVAASASLASGGSGRNGASARPGGGRPPRRRLTLAAGLAGLLLLTGVATAVFAGDDPPATPVDPVADSAASQSAEAPKSDAEPVQGGKTKAGAKKKRGEPRKSGAGHTAVQTPATGPTVEQPTSSAESIPSQEGTGGGSPSEPASRPTGSPGRTAVQPTRRTSAPKPSSKPQPAPTPTSTAASTPQPAPEPAPTPAPAPEEPPPAEESPGKSGEHADPPGKPAGRPPGD